MNEEAKNLLAQARTLKDFGRVGEAATLLQRALALAPNDSTLLCNLAVAYYEEEQWHKMLACVEKAIAASSGDEWPHRLHSAALRQLNRRVESLAAANEAVRCLPDDRFTIQNLSVTLLYCGKLEEAKEAASRLVQIAPEKALSHVTLARAYGAQGQWAEVERCVQQALGIEPENIEALDLLAHSLSFRKQKKAAIDCNASLLRLKPTHNKAQTRLHSAFENPFFIFLTLVAPVIWLCFYRALTPVLLPITAHGFVVGLCAFCCALCFTMTVNALVFKFCPSAFLKPQPAFRQQPVHIREYIVQACKREWLSNKWAVYAATMLLIALAIVAFQPYLIYKRLRGIRLQFGRRVEKPDTSI